MKQAGVPAYAAAAFRWWRLAVMVYVPALLLTVVGAVLRLDATVTAAAEQIDATPDEVRGGIIFSLIAATLAQALVAGFCWFVAPKLLQGNAGARMILTVLAAIFVINALFNLVGVFGTVASGNASEAVIEILIAALVAIASSMATAGSVLAFRGDRNREFFQQ